MKWLTLVTFLLLSSYSFSQQQVETNHLPTSTTPTTQNSTPPATDVNNVTTSNSEPNKESVHRFIRDSITIPLRNGASSGFKIVHKGLKSGTIVSLISENAESQYSLVKTADGIEGWLPSLYLMEETPSSFKLAQAEEMIKKLSQQAGPNGEQLIDINRKNQELTLTIEQLNEELNHVKSISADEIRLSDENKNILTQYQEAKNKLDTLISENQRLQSQVTQDSFMNGTIAVILGIIATLIIQHLTKANKRHSDWA